MSRVKGIATEPGWLLAAVAVGLSMAVLPLIMAAGLVWAALFVVSLFSLIFLLFGWPFSGVALLILAALFTRYRFDVGPVSVRPEHVAAVGVAAIGFVQYLVNQGRLRLPLAFWFALGWWLMNGIAGLFFSPFARTGLQNSVRLALLVLTFFLVINLIPDRRTWWRAFKLFLVAGVIEAGYGIVARAVYPFGINLGVQVSWNFTEPIPYGTFEEGNLFGSHTASWAIVLLMLLFSIDILRRPPTWRHLLYFLGLGILLLGLFLSLSRAAWLTFAAGAGLVWVFYRPQRWHQMNRFLLVIVSAPFAALLILSIAPLLPSSIPYVERLQSFLSLSRDATFSARLSDWALALDDWRKQPLTGWGPGSFFDLHGMLRGNPAWISSLNIRLLQETGIIGALSFYGFFLALLVPAFKIAGRLSEPRDRAALLGLGLSYLVLLGLAYQSTDGIWLAASWVHAGLIVAGSYVLPRASASSHAKVPPNRVS
ncbi:MAG: O-antigen ligase domain-containing protein [Chloroflexi bacterium]|nr:MAG: O-antigen ligase domain-containing protein [Chloroflexota bacterium]